MTKYVFTVIKRHPETNVIIREPITFFRNEIEGYAPYGDKTEILVRKLGKKVFLVIDHPYKEISKELGKIDDFEKVNIVPNESFEKISINTLQPNGRIL